MATKGKDGTTPTGKEKRGTSPSSSLARQPIDPAGRKRIPKLQPGQPSSPDKSPGTTAQSPDRQVPNYLKSTISSRTDQSSTQKYVPKKNLPEDPLTAKKPLLSRRSSFDKPPSPSKLVQKPLGSATSFKERDRPPMHHLTPSASLKASTSRKPISERPVITKTQTKTVYRPVRSTGPSTVLKSKAAKPAVKSDKDTFKTNDANLVPEVLNGEEKSPELEGEVESQESLMNDVEEELVKVESGVDLLPPEIATLPETAASIPVTVASIPETAVTLPETAASIPETTVTLPETAASIPETAVTLPEIATLPENNQSVDESTIQDNLKTDEETHEEEEEEIQKLDDIPTVAEDKNDTPNQAEDTHEEHHPLAESKDNEIKQIQEETIDAEESSTVVQPDPEPQEEVAKPDEKEKETETRPVGKEEVIPKPVASTSQAMKRTAGNKKDNAPAYNDVIEETKNKLMEKRKNKVRALVGAFETVISLEEA